MVKLRAGDFLAASVAFVFFSSLPLARAVSETPAGRQASYGDGAKAQLLEEGLEAYNGKDYANAVILLREAIAGGGGNPDVHYMLIMSEMYAEDFDSAIGDCDAFAASYPGSPLGASVAYQKGKALHYRGENDRAVIVLSDFCHENPGSSVYPSALYWIAECFYEDYNFEMAEGLFQRILDVYPNDRKAVDARYKIDAIAQREREQKLLDILKANNERFLEQKASYEQQLKGMESADIATLKRELAQANARIRELEARLAEEKAALAAAGEEAERARSEAAEARSALAEVEEAQRAAERQPEPASLSAPEAREEADTSGGNAPPGGDGVVSFPPSARGVTEQELLELKLRASQLQRLLDEKYSASRENKAE